MNATVPRAPTSIRASGGGGAPGPGGVGKRG